MYLNSTRINENIVYYDDDARTGNKEKWVDAIGRGVVKDLNHFTTYNADEWTVTTFSDGSAYQGDDHGGVLHLESDALALGRAGVQRHLCFQLTADDPLYFGCRWKLTDATESNAFVGLSVTASNPINGVTDGVYFRKVDGADAIAFATEKDSTETSTSTGIDAVDDTYVVTEFYWNGGVASSISITSVGTTATVTNTAHGLTTGWTVTISGANEGDYNGTFAVTVVDVDTYTYTMSGDPASPATGTIVETLNAVTGYVNGVLKVTSTTNIPDDEVLGVILSFKNGHAANEWMTVDWVRCIQCLEAE